MSDIQLRERDLTESGGCGRLAWKLKGWGSGKKLGCCESVEVVVERGDCQDNEDALLMNERLNFFNLDWVLE